MRNDKPLIAIVNDDESICQGLKKLANLAGMEADTFVSGKRFIKGKPWLGIDCVVLDVQMPKLGGLEIQKRLARSGFNGSVVFITGDPDPGIREEALAAGAAAFLYKPFSAELFIKTLKDAVRRSTHRDNPRVRELVRT